MKLLCFVFCFVSSCCSAVVFVADASSTTGANQIGPIRNPNSKGAIEKRNASERPTSVDYLIQKIKFPSTLWLCQDFFSETARPRILLSFGANLHLCIAPLNLFERDINFMNTIMHCAVETCGLSNNVIVSAPKRSQELSDTTNRMLLAQSAHRHYEREQLKP